MRNRTQTFITCTILLFWAGTPEIFSETTEGLLYSATARISVSDETLVSHPIFLSIRVSSLQSQPVSDNVIDSLNLQKKWGKDSAELPFEATLKELKRSVSIYHQPGTKLIEILVKRNDPVEAANIANEIANTYYDYGWTILREENQLYSKALTEALADQQKRLDVAKQTVDQVKKELSDAGIDCQYNLETDLITLKQLEKDKATARRLMAETAELDPEHQLAKKDLERLDTIASKIRSRNSPAHLAQLRPLRRAQSDLESEEFIYNHLQTKIKQKKDAGEATRNPVEIIDVAKPSNRPINQASTE